MIILLSGRISAQTQAVLREPLWKSRWCLLSLISLALSVGTDGDTVWRAKSVTSRGNKMYMYVTGLAVRGVQ